MYVWAGFPLAMPLYYCIVDPSPNHEFDGYFTSPPITSYHVASYGIIPPHASFLLPLATGVRDVVAERRAGVRGGGEVQRLHGHRLPHGPARGMVLLPTQRGQPCYRTGTQEHGCAGAALGPRGWIM